MDEVALHASFAARAPGGPDLGAADVHVWAVPLTGESEGYMELLSAEERDKAARFRFVDHRRRYAITHGALRAILAGYLGADPLALQFTTVARGKPALRDGHGPHFNLSHSGQLTLIAVGAVGVGIDIEKLRHLESLRDIARRHFSKVEIDALTALPEPDQLRGFYRCWTRKEAFIKATGQGLSSALDAFDVALGASPSLLACRADGEDPAAWRMWDVSPGPEYVGALAARAPDLQLATFRLQGP
jgi:4'-phosphopantetheinyl transferase